MMLIMNKMLQCNVSTTVEVVLPINTDSNQPTLHKVLLAFLCPTDITLD